MTIKMTNKARTAARSLAVAYDAYNEARNERRSSGISVWGERLIEAQEETGIELYAPRLIRHVIADNRASTT